MNITRMWTPRVERHVIEQTVRLAVDMLLAWPIMLIVGALPFLYPFSYWTCVFALVAGRLLASAHMWWKKRRHARR